MQDVRQKLIQNKRNVTDARDVLAKMAKTHDARSRLDRMRSKQGNRTAPIAPSSSKIKVIGKNIVQKVDGNGKISLVTNKARNTSNINLAIQKQLGLLPATRPPVKRIQNRKPQSPKPSPPKTRKAVSNGRSYAASMSEASREYNDEMYRWLKPDLRPASHLINSLEPTRQAMREVMREELLMANRGWSNLITPK